MKRPARAAFLNTRDSFCVGAPLPVLAAPGETGAAHVEPWTDLWIVALKRLIPRQPVHQRGVTDAVMAADQKGIEGARIGMFHGGMLGQGAKLAQGGRADPQQAAHLAGTVDRPGAELLGLEQLPEVGFGLRPEVGGRLAPADAPKTA